MQEIDSKLSLAVLFTVLSTSSVPAYAESAAPLSALAEMPVKEITVFKDGHAFVLHEGAMSTDGAGNVVMDYLPTPVMGTFWSFSADKAAKLSSVISSRRKVLIPNTALNLRELIEANPNSDARIVELRGAGDKATFVEYDATIVGIPVRTSEELEETSPPNSGEMLPIAGEVVLLKTASGVSAVPLTKIDSIAFKNNPQSKFSKTDFRNLMTLKLNWSGQPQKKADVGMVYLQRGIRWIPQYKVEIDGDGTAVVKLQASIVNDLVDLKDVTANLVVGVPKFAFKGTPDPISMQQSIAALSPYFRDESAFDNRMSNAIMSQTARMSESTDSSVEPAEAVSGTAKAEDLFLYTVKHITLKKGQRMVLPVCEATVKYKDLYTLDIPFTPPPEMRQYFHGQQRELEKLLAQPKFMHKIRLTNKTDFPFTTAPALIVHNNRVLAQGMMTYTAIGAATDLAVTTAVDIKVKKEDKETSRSPNATTWQGNQYGKIDLDGTIAVTNYSGKPVDLEVRRNVLGKVVSADHGGKAEMVNVIEDEDVHAGELYPTWWTWYSWPAWWGQFNGVGKITWRTTLDPKQSTDLGYKWSYYWR
ncbi:MAG: hypothetical protein K2W95_13570 [Candidatus Obscuribacterales bacterium]|nr:hypothetical protein [Candidatus Obscuribacterales bacterium]